jgi:branched-chain amino acid transport system substrate-binding protein
MRRRLPFLRSLFSTLLPAALLVTGLLGPPSVRAQAPPLKLAILTSLTDAQGVPDEDGRVMVDSVRLAVEEANAESSGPRIELDVYDDRTSDVTAREVASKIAASDALAVVGPMFSTSAVTAGPILARAGIALVAPVAESDPITNDTTTFRTIFKNSDLGDWLANYMRSVLGGKRAVVIFTDDVYGRTLTAGFRRGAGRVGLDTTYYGFNDAAERDKAVLQAAAAPDKPMIVLATQEDDAAAAIVTLRRLGVDMPILGGTFSEDSLVQLFKDLPEERETRGFFTRNLYAAEPVLLDSANEATLDFVNRFKARFGAGHTVSWIAVQSYDGARLAIAALREAARKPDLQARRAAVPAFLQSLNGPARAVAGVLGPIWFLPDRGRSLPIRIGHFRDGLMESAPIQLVPDPSPDPREIVAGALVEIGPGEYAHRQKVVYAGIFLNEIGRIDLAQSTFTADFYVWMRFAADPKTTGDDPTQIEFPHMVRGTFASNRPADGHDLADGMAYRLWRINGDFKNDFYLQHYPADRQELNIQFFNARAASDRLVYVVDRSAVAAAPPTARSTALPASAFPSTAAGAFRNLTQWQPLRVDTFLDNLVAQSALGDPGLVGLERVRELSGFKMEMEVQRNVGTTLVKTLLPVGLMTLIIFSTLYFPPGLAGPKVAVAITGALSGAVLLSSINAQLGNVGYVIAVEYGFYVFFALCLVSIVHVLVSEKYRIAGHSTVTVDRIARALFMLGFAATIAAAAIAFWNWR